jgi:hypothetical protein
MKLHFVIYGIYESHFEFQMEHAISIVDICILISNQTQSVRQMLLYIGITFLCAITDARIRGPNPLLSISIVPSELDGVFQHMARTVALAAPSAGQEE